MYVSADDCSMAVVKAQKQEKADSYETEMALRPKLSGRPDSCAFVVGCLQFFEFTN